MSNKALKSAVGVSDGSVLPSDQAEIYIKFPREGCSYTFEEASKSFFDRFPNAKGRVKGLTVIRVSLADEACVTVSGFSMPFANADDAQIYVVVRLAPDVASKRFSVDKLPPPFVYPHGTDQEWDVFKFKNLIKANGDHQFETAFSHPDNNHHMTVAWYGMVWYGMIVNYIEHPGGVEPVLTCVQFATIFKRDKVKKEKEPNHVTSTLARYLKSTYLEQARVWKSDRRREFHKVAETMTYAIGPSTYTFGSNRIAKNAAKKGAN
ncbi:hypothetical protein H0G86_010923 [Trichoderma simmonsii]|uniref:Uncharacterized protein n=1 Tax=Trichoderma simmonsii TaxID=1491479 RepID=A0A8G0LPT4_9HYPO|nr:hypothetical protein H0G86_010923 [Trichoderma simmonsii]